jgi:hypothetical protein
VCQSKHIGGQSRRRGGVKGEGGTEGMSDKIKNKTHQSPLIMRIKSSRGTKVRTCMVNGESRGGKRQQGEAGIDAS